MFLRYTSASPMFCLVLPETETVEGQVDLLLCFFGVSGLRIIPGFFFHFFSPVTSLPLISIDAIEYTC